MLGPVAASAPALTDVLALFWPGTHNHQPSLLQGTFSSSPHSAGFKPPGRSQTESHGDTNRGWAVLYSNTLSAGKILTARAYWEGRG